ncbi:MAG: hypothetical protein SGARI_006478, partial [Bacillariaceae sp.]
MTNSTTKVSTINTGPDEESSLTLRDDASFEKDWPVAEEDARVMTGDRFFKVGIVALLLALVGIETAQLVSAEDKSSKMVCSLDAPGILDPFGYTFQFPAFSPTCFSSSQICYGVSALVLIVCLACTLVLYGKHSEHVAAEEKAKSLPSYGRRLSMAGSIDTVIDMESLPPTPPPPILRKEMSTATIKCDNKSTPVAQYYPSVTVLFADVVHFTEWSSIRDPYQVFSLLETLFEAFDVLAEQKGIFKVETVGDCCEYETMHVAEHAVLMAKFSRRALEKATSVFMDLEESLGPGTAELGMRYGIHSGP